MELNDKILTLISSYPQDGSFPYWWPQDNSVPGYCGVTEDLIYKDEVIAKAHEQKTYCCGLTFEWFFKTAMAEGLDLGTVNQVKHLRLLWFIAIEGKRAGPVDALNQCGLGHEVSFDQAKPGDFLQIWRRNGSGHSLVLLDKIEHGIEYISTQPSTNGIGKRKEYYTPVKQSNDIIKMHIARMVTPEITPANVAS